MKMNIFTFSKLTFIVILIIKISLTLQGKNKCKYIDYHIKKITEKDEEVSFFFLIYIFYIKKLFC